MLHSLKNFIVTNRPMRGGRYLLLSLTILLYFVSAFCFTYLDQQVNASQSVIFWDSILHGRLLYAYQDALDIIGTEREHMADIPMCYEPLSYFILGIMNFPAVILYEIGVLKFSSIYFYIFVKTQQIIMALIATFYVYKINVVLSGDKKINKYSVYLTTLMFLLSPGLIYFAILMGQMEIYATTFALIGIYYWLKHDNIKFTLFFAISIPFKIFTFLIFVPLVLLREKKIIKIILYCYSGLLFYILPKLLYSTSDAYITSLAENKNRIKSLITENWFITGFNREHVSTFIICLILVYVCAYLFKPVHQEKKWGLYYCFVIFVLFFIFVPHYSYWIVIITPFIPILSAANPQVRSLNVILSTIFWCSYLLLTTSYFYFMSSFDMTASMLLPHVFGDSDRSIAKYPYLTYFLSDIGLVKYNYMVNAAYIGALLGLVIINFPGLKKFPIPLSRGDLFLVVIRAMVIVLTIVGLIYIYYKPNDVILDTTTAEGGNLSYNIFNANPKGNEDGFRQILTFEEQYEIKNISLNLSNAGQNFTAYGSVVIKLEDPSGNELFTQKLGYNQIINGEYTKIKVPNVIVNPHTQYGLVLEPDRYMSVGGVYVGATKGKKLPGSLLFHGQDTGRSLLMKINGEKYRTN